MSALSLYEMEALPELAAEGEAEWESAETSLGELGSGETGWTGNQWNALQTPGSWQRNAALAAARSVLRDATGEATFEASLLPSQESEMEWESEAEISPIRRIYVDAMMEHMAHEAMEAESEDEAAEGFLPLIPMIAGKLLPLAAKVLPKLAGKMLPRVAGKVMPRIFNTVSRATPQLSRGVSNITRTLYRNPRTRPLIRAVPNIARRAVTTIARQAAAGRPVTPASAQRVLAQQAYRVLARPQVSGRVVRRSAAVDGRYHASTTTKPTARAGMRYCPSCGTRVAQRPTRGCSCSCY